jgi:small subunit ribosomal protein S9
MSMSKPTQKKTAEKAGKAGGAAAKKEAKVAFSTGKRKKAVARASITPGKGLVIFNSQPVDAIVNESVRLLIKEPLMIAGDAWKRLNISVTARGGGIMGQAQAARQAIAKALADILGADARKAFMEYDRNMLVYDPRRTEPHKPPRSSQGPRRYKQRSKR